MALFGAVSRYRAIEITCCVPFDRVAEDRGACTSITCAYTNFWGDDLEPGQGGGVGNHIHAR